MKTRTQPVSETDSHQGRVRRLNRKHRPKAYANLETAAAAPEAPQVEDLHCNLCGKSSTASDIPEASKWIVNHDCKPQAQHSPLPDANMLTKALVHQINSLKADVEYWKRAFNQADACSLENESNYERVKAERDKAWATSNRHLIERNQRIEQVRELLAACKLVKAIHDAKGEWQSHPITLDPKAYEQLQAAIKNAEKPTT